MKDIRDTQKEPPSFHGSRVRTCSALGCGSGTREGKPYCPKHVEMHPYVKGVVAVRDTRATEIAGILKGRRVIEHSLLFDEIIKHIEDKGPKTVERLSRDLMINVAVIKKLVVTMKRRKIIKTTRSIRGSVVVRAV